MKKKPNEFYIDSVEYNAALEEIIDVIRARGIFDADTIASLGLAMLGWSLTITAATHGKDYTDMVRDELMRGFKSIEYPILPPERV